MASLGDLIAMLERTGFAHAVLVQPSPYGADHSCLLDTLAAMEGRCAGVASFPAHTAPDDQMLARLDAAGVRGLRVHTLHADPATAITAAKRDAAIARELGWHLEMQLALGQLDLVEAIASRTDIPIVLDHLARARPADLSRLHALLRGGGVFVKLSAVYRQPDRVGALRVARALLTDSPQCCLWGSDWPHTPLHSTNAEAAERTATFRKIDIARDLDAVFGCCGEAALRMALCDVPAHLYGRQKSERRFSP